ncbi:DeoR/GlpR family DNA-binding transcription regulator [Caenispirillum salinarum]|uniref:DeoR/GlpR family DNA-binding transcription regulator n=1 Tax=Caenispirillum salinarum TaxID=859058 RepID=UPI00384E28B1
MTTPQERRARIAEQVRQAGFASIESLATHFAVTEQTVRRDVNALCDQGVLRRRHGGVELPIERENLPYENRKVLNLAEKRAIAAMVAARIPDGASLFFSIGTTPELVAQALCDHSHLRVFTNNLNVAAACCGNPTFEVTIVGGRLRNRYRDVVGHEVNQFFSQYKVDFGVFGVGGIDSEGGLLDFAEEEVRAREAILANSRRSILIADHTKFGRNAVVRGGSITDVDLFCTNRPLQPDMAARLEAAEVEVLLAEVPAALA